MNSVPKSMQWSLDILTQIDDNRFLQLLRVNRVEFDAIVDMISDFPDFTYFMTAFLTKVPLSLKRVNIMVFWCIYSLIENLSIFNMVYIWKLSLTKLVPIWFLKCVLLESIFLKRWPLLAYRMFFITEDIVNYTLWS